MAKMVHKKEDPLPPGWTKVPILDKDGKNHGYVMYPTKERR